MSPIAPFEIRVESPCFLAPRVSLWSFRHLNSRKLASNRSMPLRTYSMTTPTADVANEGGINAEGNQLYSYSAPSFIKQSNVIDNAPKHRLKLAMRPTPIQPFHLPMIKRGDIKLYIKRDDMTGITESGNKIRKLEFLFADAIASNHDCIITAGGVQSNHARAVSVLCRRLGLEPHVFLRSTLSKIETDPNDSESVNQLIGFDGNVLIHRLCKTYIHIVPRMSFLSGLLPRMQALKQQLHEENGKKAYIIGIGGSDEVGVWGYIEAYAEIAKQCQLGQEISHIVLSTGSGGTAAGLAIGNFLNGSPVKIVAFTVSDTPEYFYDHIDEMLTSLGISEVKATDTITILENKGKGYGINSKDDLRSVSQICSASGILLDPTYTLKGVRGLIAEANKSTEHSVFPQDARILFIHTGGLFGLFDRRVEPYVDTSLASLWTDDQVK